MPEETESITLSDYRAFLGKRRLMAQHIKTYFEKL